MSGTLRRTMVCGVILSAALIAYGLLRWPATLTSSAGMRSVAGAALILVVYALAAWFGLPATARAYPRLPGQSTAFGLLIGALFAAQMLYEYLAPLNSDQDATLALVTFGTLFALFFLAGLIAATRSGAFRQGVLAAIWSALIGSLLWLILLWITYYAFVGTAYEANLLEIDQTNADFLRSGMSDLRAFIMQDYLGGSFFHLTLAPLLAAILGALGSLVGKGVAKLSRR
jgi:hypothetical protein